MSASLDRLTKRASAVSSKGNEQEIPLAKIKFDFTQPRKSYHHVDGQIAEKDQQYIVELAESIKTQKLIQAITLRENGDDTFTVVVGECRTRAHILLGLPTIRAVIRNDLSDPSDRLLFQLAENVNREGLSDHELALSILELKNGSETMAKKTQVEIARAMGKSEAWVVRFLKFADAEMQRIWVTTGIADTPEKVYRLSILPIATQVDIQRRVSLPDGDAERLEIPLNRNVIEQLKSDAKTDRPGVKLAGISASTKPIPTQGAFADDGSDVARSAGGALASGLNRDDLIGKAFEAAAIDGHAAAAVPDGGVTPSAGYQLSNEARNAIIGAVPALLAEAQSEGRKKISPPINCRVTVANILALAEMLKSHSDLRAAVDTVWCDVLLPGGVAQSIANLLSGIIVDDKEVSAIMQKELVKLR